MAEKQRGLGRGFDSLIPVAISETEFEGSAALGAGIEGEVVREVDPGLVDPNPHQPRKSFEQEALEALSASIRVHGILQPLIVSQKGDRYELIAGERRLRAAKIAGLDKVPVLVRSIDEQAKLEIALIENIQREELNAIEMATAYRMLIDQFNLTNAQIGEKVGKDVSTIANTIRLLGMPVEAKQALIEGKITEGHGLAILFIPEKEPEKRLELLRLIQKHKWGVVQATEFARGFMGSRGTKKRAMARIATETETTVRLGQYLGTKVIQKNSARGGKLIIEYRGEDDLNRIAKMISRED
jgi:ParB family chromosome partitioning protein